MIRIKLIVSCILLAATIAIVNFSFSLMNEANTTSFYFGLGFILIWVIVALPEVIYIMFHKKREGKENGVQQQSDDQLGKDNSGRSSSSSSSNPDDNVH